MKILMWLLVMVLTVSLQSTVIPAISAGGVHPDFVMVVVVLAALMGGRETGVLCGVVGGLLQDLLSVGPFGVHTLTKMTLGLLLGFYERKVNQGNLLLPMLAIIAGTVGFWRTVGLVFAGVWPGRRDSGTVFADGASDGLSFAFGGAGLCRPDLAEAFPGIEDGGLMFMRLKTAGQRLDILTVVLVTIFLLLSSRLAYLQVMKGTGISTARG
jgi:rod shape-determining protein MreD